MKTRLYLEALTPVAQGYGQNTTGDYIDGGKFTEIDYVLTTGAIAATKTVTIEIYAADDTSGTNATKIAENTITGITGGTTAALGTVHVEIVPENKRYLAAKVSNTLASSSVSIAVTAVCTPKYSK